jgi:hypothetical protein
VVASSAALDSFIIRKGDFNIYTERRQIGFDKRRATIAEEYKNKRWKITGRRVCK